MVRYIGVAGLHGGVFCLLHLKYPKEPEVSFPGTPCSEKVHCTLPSWIFLLTTPETV